MVHALISFNDWVFQGAITNLILVHIVDFQGLLGNFFGFQEVIDLTEIIFKNPENVHPPPVWTLNGIAQ